MMRIFWFVTLWLLGTPSLSAQPTIDIEQAWIRTPIPGKNMTAAYFTLRNTGDKTLRLVGADWKGAQKIELHTMRMQGGVMHMRLIKEGVTLAPGAVHLFRPGGDHLMLFGLKSTQPVSPSVSIRLIFDSGESLSVPFVWRSAQAMMQSPGMTH